MKRSAIKPANEWSSCCTVRALTTSWPLTFRVYLSMTLTSESQLFLVDSSEKNHFSVLTQSWIFTCSTSVTIIHHLFPWPLQTLPMCCNALPVPDLPSRTVICRQVFWWTYILRTAKPKSLIQQGSTGLDVCCYWNREKTQSLFPPTPSSKRDRLFADTSYPAVASSQACSSVL